MTRPTDEQLEAMAARLEQKSLCGPPSWIETPINPIGTEAAAMLRACKTGDAPDHSDWNAAIEAAAEVSENCTWRDFWDMDGKLVIPSELAATIRALKKGPPQ